MSTPNNQTVTIPEAFRIALDHHLAGRMPQAKTLYRQILQAEPDHPYALNQLGFLLFQAGLHQQAAEHIEKAVELRSDIAEFHANLGECKWRSTSALFWRRAIEARFLPESVREPEAGGVKRWGACG